MLCNPILFMKIFMHFTYEFMLLDLLIFVNYDLLILYQEIGGASLQNDN